MVLSGRLLSEGMVALVDDDAPGTSTSGPMAPATPASPAAQAAKKNPCHHYCCLPPEEEEEEEGEFKKKVKKKKRARELDEEVHGTLDDPKWTGEMARKYPFELDNFQEKSVACLERRENVMVAAHTSAGKTAVAEYAIAMAFRDNQRVVYTSPLKALSNQKYRELGEEFDGDVGLMTGDNSIGQNSTCIVMTTEIMRSMIYKGSDTMREVAWVIFDEVHYMKDKERGVVWEESIIFLPPKVKMVFLSATLSNAAEFAGWVAKLRGEPCHVVYTDQRPVPLRHFGFPKGGAGMHLLCDEFGNFKSDSFHALMRTFGDNNGDEKGQGGEGARQNGRGAKPKGSVGGEQDLFRLVKTVKDMNDLPIIVFSFSRRQCEESALKISKLDFTDDDEKEQIEDVYRQALMCLSEEDRTLGAIEHMLPLLKKGIGIHHGGLLPILKELIEILFQEQLIKILFATETFAMGLNMPAKTVIFTAMRKWDGESNRFMASGEYIQMSGRAGRRGKDLQGNAIMMIDKDMDEKVCSNIISGKPLPLLSNYKLTYYTLLNLLRRQDGTAEQEKTIERSFHQYQHQVTVPAMRREAEALREESSSLCKDEQGLEVQVDKMDKGLKHLAELQGLRLDLTDALLRSETCFTFLCPGRLVHVVDGTTDWGWGILISAFRRTRRRESSRPSGDHVCDVMLPCARAEGGEPAPARSARDPEVEALVLPVSCSCLAEVSSLRVGLPRNLRDDSGRKKVQTTIASIVKKYGDLPLLHPARDMGLQDKDDLWFDITAKKGQAMQAAKGRKARVMNHHELGEVSRKLEIRGEIAKLEQKIKDSQVTVFNREIDLRSAVLRKLGHIDDAGVLQLKGRAACEVDTADELLASELMLEGCFTDLDAHQVVGITSCLVPVERTQSQPDLEPSLRAPLAFLRDTAAHIARVSNECGLDVDEEEYVDSFKSTLVNVSYGWSKGKKFSEICEETDVFEGSIIRAMRRLNELLGQLREASSAIGDQGLAEKFAQASESIQRGIVFANSLYIA